MKNGWKSYLFLNGGVLNISISAR